MSVCVLQNLEKYSFMDRFFSFLSRNKSVFSFKNRSRTSKTDDFSSPVCDPSIELSLWHGSNERSQYMFSLRNKKNYLWIIYTLYLELCVIFWLLPYSVLRQRFPLTKQPQRSRSVSVLTDLDLWDAFVTDKPNLELNHSRLTNFRRINSRPITKDISQKECLCVVCRPRSDGFYRVYLASLFQCTVVRSFQWSCLCDLEPSSFHWHGSFSACHLWQHLVRSFCKNS